MNNLRLKIHNQVIQEALQILSRNINSKKLDLPQMANKMAWYRKIEREEIKEELKSPLILKFQKKFKI